MSKFVNVKDIPADEHVVLDVPIGHLRVGGTVHANGEGLMVFSIASEARRVGSRPGSARSDRDAVKIVVQTPEKAETIALAFIEMARKMRDVLDTDYDEEDEEDDDGFILCEGNCEFCECPCAGEEV